VTARRFILRRYEDVSGISGRGDVAEGVVFSLTAHERAIGATDGAAAIRWLTEWPTSVAFEDRGLASVEHIHGHSGATRIVFLDPPDDDPEPSYGYGDYQGAMADLDVLLDLVCTVVNDSTLRVGREGAMRPSVERLAAHIDANYPGRRP
jgi:hypothetical protein